MLPVTAYTVAIMALVLTALSLNVSRLRLKHRVSFGHGEHKDLHMAVRAHGNALEQTTLFALLLITLEGLASSNGLLVPLATTFVIARITHALALFARQLRLRQLSHIVSVALQLVAAFAILARALSS